MVACICSTASTNLTAQVASIGSGLNRFYPNEPEGHVRVAYRDFSALSAAATGWDDGPPGGITYVVDSTAVASPPGVARMVFQRGWRSGVAPGHAEFRFERRHRQIYVSYWFKVSDNWYGQRVVSKIGYAWIGGRPMFYLGLVGAGRAPLRVQVRLQDLDVPPAQGANLQLRRGRGRIWRDHWHQVEAVLVANDAGLRNGKVMWWVDSRFVGAAYDIGWVRDGSAAWEGISWRPVWGGSGGTVPEDQYMYLDDLYVSALPE